MQRTISAIFLLTVLCLSTSLHAQKVNHQKLQRQIRNHFDLEDYDLAVPKLNQLIQAYPDSGLYHFQLGVAYWYSERQHTAHPHLKKAEGLGFKHPRLDFYRARTEHVTHHFEEAIPYYELYLTEMMANADETPEEIKRFITECQVGKELKENALSVEIEHLGTVINSKYPEYVPLINETEDLLIFTTCRPENTGGHKDFFTELYYEDVYFSKKENGEWKEPKSIGPNINTNHHDANVALSPDGKSLIIFQGQGRFGQEGGDLVISHLEENANGEEEWSLPEPLPTTINSKYKEPSASFSADKNILFFSSDRPGGLGGLDIYYSVKDENGKWGEAVNLGPKINTDRDEDAPYIHPDGTTLFFSSTGHANIGGFDIFYVEYDSAGTDWGSPVNMGYPINTAGDDIYFVWSSNAQRGYYSSYRQDSYGDKDLYVIHRPNEEDNRIIVKGVLTDAVTGQPLLATLHVHEKESKEFVGAFESDVQTGKYAMSLTQGHDYDISVLVEEDTLLKTELHVPEKTAYFEITMDLTIVIMKEVVSEVETPMETVAGEPVMEEVDKTEEIAASLSEQISAEVEKATSSKAPEPEAGDEEIVLHYGFDQSNISSGEMKFVDEAYQKLMANEKLELELIGHTDNIGDQVYNQYLSERRAQIVADYLIKKKGVQPDRIHVKGMGFKEPIASNKTKEGRRENRRTEMSFIVAGV